MVFSMVEEETSMDFVEVMITMKKSERKRWEKKHKYIKKIIKCKKKDLKKKVW